MAEEEENRWKDAFCPRVGIFVVIICGCGVFGIKVSGVSVIEIAIM